LTRWASSLYRARPCETDSSRPRPGSARAPSRSRSLTAPSAGSGSGGSAEAHHVGSVVMANSTDLLLARLVHAGFTPKQHGSRWECRCPAHDDQVASLSLAQGEKGVVLTCHAGCATPDVVAALGLKMSDLFDNQNGHARAVQHDDPVVVATLEWDIRGVDGAVVATHVRRDLSNGRKKFAWRRGAVWNLGGMGSADLPLYGVERLAGTTGPVVVCEGEKATDALLARGLVAVGTVTGAAECPGRAALEPLRGRTVVLWPDADQQGWAHMRAVGTALTGIATDVTVFDWAGAPPKGDAADWPGTTDELRTALGTAKPFSQPDTALMELPTVLIPGTHRTPEGDTLEVGCDQFAANTLATLPDGTMYRMGREVGVLEGPAGERAFQQLSDTSARLLVDAHVRLGRWMAIKQKGDVPAHQVLVYVPCTKDLAGLVVEAARLHGKTRKLDMLVPYPVFLRGFDLARPGWNERGGVFYDEPPELVGLVPDATSALDVLDDLVVDFPLKDEASRQNCYAAMLTLLCRPAIAGPTPFFLALASLERTGKGKLIDTALGMAVLGRQVTPMQIGREEAETEKRITAQILSGTPVLHLDNVPVGELLSSASLASLATAYPTWGGRKLGHSEIVSLPNRMVVVLSANNPKATGELVKRTVPIVLEARDDHPELRDDFKHQDCYAYATERRRAVLAALTGIVAAWKGVGSPPCKVKMGGFEQWGRAVLAPLQHAGATQLLGNYRTWCQAADDQNADFETLIRTWVLLNSGAQMASLGLLELVQKCGIFHDVLSAPTQHGKIMMLTLKVLTPLTDRPVLGWIVRKDTSGSNSTFRLVRTMP